MEGWMKCRLILYTTIPKVTTKLRVHVESACVGEITLQ